MGDVVRLPSTLERGAHLSGEAFCVGCGHEWVAVAPVGTIELECPSCHVVKGLMKYGCELDTAWTCGCGCYVFMISPNGVICWHCGEYARGLRDEYTDT